MADTPSAGTPPRPIVAPPGGAPVAAAGATLVVREWSDPGPSYLHIHRSDDEAWHVLEGVLRFRFADHEAEAPAGTTVFVPAGTPHTYSVVSPGRYLIVLTPRLDRLIARLRALEARFAGDRTASYRSALAATLAEADTVIAE
jgi:hypothetical protein